MTTTLTTAELTTTNGGFFFYEWTPADYGIRDFMTLPFDPIEPLPYPTILPVPDGITDSRVQ